MVEERALSFLYWQGFGVMVKTVVDDNLTLGIQGKRGGGGGRRRKRRRGGALGEEEEEVREKMELRGAEVSASQ